MNTANKITVARMIMVPVFILFLLWYNLPYNYLYALIVFVLASATDAVDGKIARKRNMVTDFGKFLDPLADKLLVLSALICFVQLRIAGAVMVIIILGREFLVTSLRMVANVQGEVIAANIWGKIKTVSQMIAIIYTLLYLTFVQCTGSIVATAYLTSFGFVAAKILLWICTAMTLISGAIYLWQNRQFLKNKG